MWRNRYSKIRTLALIAGVCSGQVSPPSANPSHYFEIKFPAGVNAETVYIRYVLAGEEFGGLVQPRSGVSSYLIDTAIAGRSAAGIKAVLHAPGCAIQTLDIALSGSNNEQYSFVCKPLASIPIAGRLTHPDRLYGRDVRLQTRYIARWAGTFLGLDDNTVPVIPVGDAVGPSADGRFRLSVPDLSSLGASDHPGEIQIWAKDKTSGELVALLIPAGAQAITTRMGGLRIMSGYPSEIAFAPCPMNSSELHDREGFALRPDLSDACDR